MRSWRILEAGHLAQATILFCVLSGGANGLVYTPSDLSAAESISQEIKQTLQSLAFLPGDNPSNLESLLRFYQRRDYRPAWCHSGGVSAGAGRWLALLRQLEQQNTPAPVVPWQDIQKRLNAGGARTLAELDLLLSGSFLDYARTVGQGQISPAQTDPKWHIPRPGIDPALLLERAIQGGRFENVINSLVPRDRGYQNLLRALADYSHIQKAGGWPVLRATGLTLAEGSEGAEIHRLREQLRMAGDLSVDDSQGTHYDPALKAAVSRFQTRHGLQADGVVGKRTRRALAVPVDERIQQIRVNLERRRWLPRDLGQRYITVNTAAFELQVHDRDAVPLSMRVIVGKKRYQTPVFTEKIQYLIVNPYWHVPSGIARRDLIPAQLHDPHYFRRKGIRVLSGWQPGAEEVDAGRIDWRSYVSGHYLPYKLRQDPGPTNALGRIKFMLPNPFRVYLHDTPARQLFGKTVRTFSAGCIRVEKPLALAAYLLGSGGTHRQGSLEAIIERGGTRAIRLPEPVPVYVLYQTAWVDRQGTVQFRDDVYRRDRRLAAALAARKSTLKGQASAGNTTISDILSLLH